MSALFRTRTTTVLLGLLTLWLAVVAVSAGYRRYTVERELAALRTRIEDGQRENERVAAELERMRTPQWLALLARQRLNYQLPDETVVFVYKAKESGIVSPPQNVPEDDRPNWRRWWEWLTARPLRD